MKSILLIGSTIVSTVTATLPLKNFPVNGRELKAYDRAVATSATGANDVQGDPGGTLCSFSTLHDLLPSDTIKTFDVGNHQNYAGGFATIIQLSGKDGYSYYMRSSEEGPGSNTWYDVDKDSSGVMCKEYEDMLMSEQSSPPTAQSSWCGEEGNGIHQVGDNFLAHNADADGSSISKDMTVNSKTFKPDAFSGNGLCDPNTISSLRTKNILGGSTCTPILVYSGEGVSSPSTPVFSGHPNGIFQTSRTCSLDSQTNSQPWHCTDTVNSVIYDIAIASLCGHSGDLSDAFVWFRYERPAYQITFNDGGAAPGGLSLADQSNDGSAGSINHWLGDILFVQPRVPAQHTFANAEPVLTELPLYVSSANAKVEFSSDDGHGNEYPGFAGRCTTAATDELIGTEADADNTNPTSAEYNCKARIEATVVLVDSGETSCTPHAYIKTSLVQFARIHEGHVEEGKNATIKSDGHAQGFTEFTGGAAMKYACSALNKNDGLNADNEVVCTTKPTDGDASLDDEWNCIDDCSVGNPFALLEYRERHELMADSDTVSIEGVKTKLRQPTINGDAIPYTYVIGYVDLGFGCWESSVDDEDLLEYDHGNRRLVDHDNRRLVGDNRRLGGSKVNPRTWERRTLMIFAGGHAVDVPK